MDTLALLPPVESVLGVLPGATQRDRILVTKIVSRGRDDVVELRQQTFGDGVGWFTQASIPLTAEQAASLANTLKANATGTSESVSAAKKARTAASLQKAVAHGLALVR